MSILSPDDSAHDKEATPPPPHPLDLGLPEEAKVVPSESDVLAILSSAHASQSLVTAGSLRRVQREGMRGHHSRREGRVGRGKDMPKSSLTGGEGGDEQQERWRLNGCRVGSAIIAHAQR